MQYYYLIAGLTEYPFDLSITTASTAVSAADKRGEGGFNVRAIRDRIRGQLSTRDGRAVEMLYRYYDVANILNCIRGSKLPFSPLGNLSPEAVRRVVDGHVGSEDQDWDQDWGQDLEQTDMQAELASFPAELQTLADRFKKQHGSGGEDASDIEAEDEQILEREMYNIFYRASQKKGNSGMPEYLRRWSQSDRIIRNRTAIYRGQTMKWPAEFIEKMIVGEEDKKAWEEQPFADALTSVLETRDFVDRERRMDRLRWDLAEELREELKDYFGIGTLLCYLIRLNILYRWAALDPEHGKSVFRATVERLTVYDGI